MVGKVFTRDYFASCQAYIRSVFSSLLMPDSQEFLAVGWLGLEKSAGGSNPQEDILRTIWTCGSWINNFWWGKQSY